MNDSKWSEHNKELIAHASKRNWGLYRNARFEMSEQLKKEGDLMNAIAGYLEVCYLDLNGPENCNGDAARAQFDTSMAFLAPGVLNRIRITSKKTGLDSARLGKLFIERGSRLHSSLKLPKTPGECWNDLKVELQA